MSLHFKHVSKSLSPGPSLSALKLQRNVLNYWLGKKLNDFEKLLIWYKFLEPWQGTVGWPCCFPRMRILFAFLPSFIATCRMTENSADYQEWKKAGWCCTYSYSPIIFNDWINLSCYARMYKNIILHLYLGIHDGHHGIQLTTENKIYASRFLECVTVFSKVLADVCITAMRMYCRNWGF